MFSTNETIEAIRVLGFWRVAFACTLYRPLSRLMHRYNLHYMPPSGPFEDGSKLLWCHWCGARHVIPNPAAASLLRT